MLAAALCSVCFLACGANSDNSDAFDGVNFPSAVDIDGDTTDIQTYEIVITDVSSGAEDGEWSVVQATEDGEWVVDRVDDSDDDSNSTSTGYSCWSCFPSPEDYEMWYTDPSAWTIPEPVRP